MGMWWLIASAVAATIAAVAVPLDLGRRDGRRWGIRRRPRSVDPSPYRGATIHEERERGAPLLVRVAAGANVAWALLTMLVFAPAGCLLFLMAAEAPLFIIFLAPVVFSGFLLSFRLMGAAGAVLGNQTEKVGQAVTWSVLHHLAVAVLFALGAAVTVPRDPWLGLLPSIPAGIGLMLAGMLHAAARRAESVRRA